MEIVITNSPAESDALVADILCAALESPTPVIGLATGSSPLGVYQLLADRHQQGQLRADHATAVILDEYLGLPMGHPESYRSVVERELTSRIGLPSNRLLTPDPSATDIAAETRRYDQLIGRLGVDVQLLGIGSDGHVGFNEPGSALRSRTRVKTLTQVTREDNARFFGGDVDAVPRHVVTQGLGTISDAAHLVLIASGRAKAPPIAAAVEGPLSAMCPASVLQLHPHVTVVVDNDAAADLALADYYRETYSHKPSWQAH